MFARGRPERRVFPYHLSTIYGDHWHMTRAHKIEALITFIVVLLLTAGTYALFRWGKQQPISIQGAVMVKDSDPRKRVPIAGVTVSAGGHAPSDAQSDSSGHFVLPLRKAIRRGHPIVLHFRSPQYHPLDVDEFVGDQLYVMQMVPLASTPPAENPPQVKVANVRVRYTVKAMTELNVGSAVKTFEIQNKGNVPCKGQHPCSPDGRWKATLGSASLDAGTGNEFRHARASCIAGPCAFTRIEGDRYSEGGQIMTVSARDWSDTATFLIEAEVVHSTVSQSEHWSYPVIFGEALSFTLPSSASSVSIEADINGQTIIFPLGPTLALSWASCDSVVNPDGGQVYRCTRRAGYRFQ